MLEATRKHSPLSPPEDLLLGKSRGPTGTADFTCTVSLLQPSHPEAAPGCPSPPPRQQLGTGPAQKLPPCPGLRLYSGGAAPAGQRAAGHYLPRRTHARTHPAHGAWCIAQAPCSCEADPASPAAAHFGGEGTTLTAAL